MARGSIVHIARTLPQHMLGGMETHAWELARAWQRRGWDVEILTSSFVDKTFVEEKDGIRIHHLRHLPVNRDEVPPWRWWRRFANRTRDYALAHRIDADAIHSESYHGHALFRALWKKGPRPACVLTLHGTQLRDYRQTGRAKLLAEVSWWHPRAIAQALYVPMRAAQERRRDFPSADRIVVPQDALVDHLATDYRVPRDRIDVIPNGVDPPLRVPDRAKFRISLGIPSDARIILFVGRLDRVKRVDRLIEHLRTHPRDRLLIAGGGEDEKRLRELVATLPNPAAARFLGVVVGEPKQRLFVAADVFALPSEMEGQPITILEALVHGTPVYTTRPWVPADVLPLVSVGPDVSAGIDAAAEMKDKVRAAADQLARKYSWDHVAALYEDVFQRCGAPTSHVFAGRAA